MFHLRVVANLRCPPTDLHARLGQVDLHGEVLPREHVRVMRLGKGALQLLQLK